MIQARFGKTVQRKTSPKIQLSKNSMKKSKLREQALVGMRIYREQGPIQGFRALTTLHHTRPSWHKVMQNCMETLNGAQKFADAKNHPVMEKRKASPFVFGKRNGTAYRRILRMKLGSAYRRPSRPLWTLPDCGKTQSRRPNLPN
jgi:hypothetical protein